MPETAQSPERRPIPTPDRELILEELDALLASHHFRGSKRYPAFLKYVVDATLDGRLSDLKERTLGVEVFGRSPNYDTSADPVVRFSAGEVRKRIAQYYHENGQSSRVQIELPLGSYVPEFQWRHDEEARKKSATVASSMLQELPRPAVVTAVNKRPGRARFLLAGVLVLLGSVFIAGYYERQHAKKTPTVSDRLWAPLVSSSRPVLIVLGTGHRRFTESDDTSFLDHMTGPFHRVSIATAAALANVASVVRQRGAAYEIKEDTETSLTDLRARPIVLIGATNNPWTMRLLGSMKFHFTPGPIAKIQDLNDPDNPQWSIDFSKPYSSVPNDYAIVARYHDPTTEGPVMVVAGVGSYGTEAASAFVATPQYLEQITRQIPAGLEGKNIEIVLKSEVVDGKTGPPVMVSYVVW
jgi:hypothetical protein